MLYPGHSLRGVLPLCIEAVDVFYRPSWLGYKCSKFNIKIKKKRRVWFLCVYVHYENECSQQVYMKMIKSRTGNWTSTFHTQKVHWRQLESVLMIASFNKSIVGTSLWNYVILFKWFSSNFVISLAVKSKAVICILLVLGHQHRCFCIHKANYNTPTTHLYRSNQSRNLSQSRGLCMLMSKNQVSFFFCVLYEQRFDFRLQNRLCEINLRSLESKGKRTWYKVQNWFLILNRTDDVRFMF